jgi:hypothetical protein
MGMIHNAQICLNGHVISTSADRHPDLSERYCSRCGAETVTACRSCSAPIRGDYDVTGSFGPPDSYALPRFCHSCGQPHPWTAARLEAAAALADELEGLSADERDLLKRSLVELVQDAPNAELAAVRVKKALRKVGHAGVETFRKVLVDVLSEAAKKSLGL